LGGATSKSVMFPSLTDALTQRVIVAARNRMHPERIIAAECVLQLCERITHAVLYVIITARIDGNFVAEQGDHSRQYHLLRRPNSGLAHDHLQAGIGCEDIS